MTSFLNTQDTTDPCDNFVGGGVGGLVQVDNTVTDVVVNVALQGRATVGDGGVVAGSDVEFVVVL